MNEKITPSLSDFVPYMQIAKKYPELFTENSWRWLAKNRHTNGLAPAFRKLNTSIYVNEAILTECFDKQVG
jgi:hypothetical protein